MITIQKITDYLSENIADPVPKYILIKEIHKIASLSSEYINAYNNMKQSAWYRELAIEQWDNGSWGKFHGGDAEAQKRQKFPCTEAALRRARELSLSKDDPLIIKCIKLMEKYALREEPYPDYIEKHNDEGKSHNFSFPFGVVANINMFDPENPVIKPFRNIVVETLKKSFANGYYNEDFYEQEIRNHRVATAPGNAFNIMLLCNSNCMEDKLQKQYLDYIWGRKGAEAEEYIGTKRQAIFYMSNFPPAEKKYLEDKNFTVWLSLLELLSGFSLFPEFIKDDALPHLLNEADRLIHGKVFLPKPPSGHGYACGHAVNGRYAENWRDINKRETDLVLRIARILAKC